LQLKRVLRRRRETVLVAHESGNANAKIIGEDEDCVVAMDSDSFVVRLGVGLFIDRRKDDVSIEMEEEWEVRQLDWIGGDLGPGKHGIPEKDHRSV
jgi:hypothetical protein